MSPEQAQGQPLDDRSDIYSLGASLYHLVTGQPPFDGKSPAVVMMRHLSEPVPSPQGIAPGLSDGLSAVLIRMLAKEPRDRPRNCHELLADLILLL